MEIIYRYCDINGCGEKAYSLSSEAKKEMNRLIHDGIEDACVECATMWASSSLPFLVDDENEKIDIKCCWNCKFFEQEIKGECFSEFSMCCKDENSPYSVERHYRCESWKDDNNLFFKAKNDSN